MNKLDQDVGTGLVGAPACGDVMKLQIRVDDNGVISDVKFKTFGCGSAIASSSYMTERVKGMTLDQAGAVRNTEIAKELSLPPVKREWPTGSGQRTTTDEPSALLFARRGRDQVRHQRLSGQEGEATRHGLFCTRTVASTCYGSVISSYDYLYRSGRRVTLDVWARWRTDSLRCTE